MLQVKKIHTRSGNQNGQVKQLSVTAAVPVNDNRPQTLLQRKQLAAMQRTGDGFLQQGNSTPIQLQPMALTRITGKWEDEPQKNDMDLSDLQQNDVVASPHEGEYEIDDVVIGGRTPSPFTNTMGAHSTAWVAHIDVVRRHLVGTTLNQGIDWMAGLINDDLASPLLKLDAYLPKPHWQKLDFARYELTVARNQLQLFHNNVRKDNYHFALQQLRVTINAYLTFINLLPTATVAGGDPSGHGEGVARGELNFFEYAAALKSEKQGNYSEPELKSMGLKGIDTNLRKILKGELTDEPLATYRKAVRETIWVMFANETPGEFIKLHDNLKADRVKEEVWALMLQNFLRTIRLAYPFAYNFAEMNNPAKLKTDLGDVMKGVDAERVVQLVTGAEKFTGIGGSYQFQDPTQKDRIEKELGDGHKLEEGITRDDAVSDTDRYQGSSGFQVTVLLDNEEKIGDIAMTGRTQSPFVGTMGAHTTAWVVHQDALAAQLKGARIPKAIETIYLLSMGAMNSQQLELSKLIDEKHQVRLVNAYNVLKKHLSETGRAMKENTGAQVHQLEVLIYDYFTFINMIPLATVAKGGVPGGRSEGRHRQFLKKYEEEGDSIFTSKETPEEKQQTIFNHLIGLFDMSGLEDFPPDLGQREETDINEHVEGGFNDSHDLWNSIKGPNPKDVGIKKEQYALQQFVNTMHEAYPKSVVAGKLIERLYAKHKKVFRPQHEHQNLIGRKVVIAGNPADEVARSYKGFYGTIKNISYYGVTIALDALMKNIVVKPYSFKLLK